MEHLMYQARRRAQPCLPSSPAELAVSLLDPINSYNRHFKAVVRVGDEYAFIFISNTILNRLGSVQEIFFDGTFFTTPSMFHQLFSIQGIFGDSCLPIVHALTTCRTEELYMAILEKLLELNTAFSPVTIMGDYEQASQNAFRRCFPDADIGGCIFHFARAIWRKAQKLGLADTYKTAPEFQILLKRLMSLPFVPPVHARILANHIFDQDCQVARPVQLRIRKLHTYVTRFWLNKITPEKFSVFRFKHATNNYCEGFHSRLKSLIRSHHPALWAYLGHLQNVISDTQVELRRIDEGLPLTRPRKKRFQLTAQRRVLYKQRLASGQYTPVTYLNAMSHTMDSSVSAMERGRGTQNEDRIGLEVDVEEAAEEEVHEDQAQREQQEEEATEEERSEQAPAAATSSRRCIICLGERTRTVLYLPCRHAQVCHRCDQYLRPGTPCPCCRAHVDSKIEIYDG